MLDRTRGRNGAQLIMWDEVCTRRLKGRYRDEALARFGDAGRRGEPDSTRTISAGRCPD